MRNFRQSTTNSASVRSRPTLPQLAVVALLLLGVLRARRVVSSALSNAALLMLVPDMLDSRSACSQQHLDYANALLRKAVDMEAENLTALRGLGFAHWLGGDDANAVEQWQKGGLQSRDLVVFGQRAGENGRRGEALRWYRLAEMLDPDDVMLWQQVGLLCQRDPRVDDICDRFLAYNDQNWLVDPKFLGGRHEGWFCDPQDVAHELGVPCPGFPGERCATISIGEDVPQHSASWQQRVYLQPGQVYRFEAWIKTEVDAATRWRPVYYGGRIAGGDQGRWPGDQVGSSDWRHWEHTFVAEAFDGSTACFHPVILRGRGQIWFFGAALTPIGKAEP